MSQSKINRFKSRHKKNSFSLAIDREKCKGCGLCVMYCPLNCLKLSDKFNKNSTRFVEFIPGSKCCGCGRCFFICPESCIEILKEKEGK
ncbi:MAG: 4Fe-4S dicluster domain-containing protein [Candidatus Omnitrophica bacterium]|nr:4Fe-4S dicluster domain-containing protein [Candidatus Omnitrophota bacterium]MBD3268688.1 4Fe-4S dicluster domain-containing protein [Candidatus Omnitrophota bacterium]